jgi:DNA-binding LacI/PurR family transcriptional regulator
MTSSAREPTGPTAVPGADAQGTGGGVLASSGREPTMADIAMELGVSRQLVSLVLREQPGASDETRARVWAAASRLGYSPHVGARTLRQSESRQLGVVFVPSHATEPDIVEAVYPAAAAEGYQLVISAVTPTRTSRSAIEELLGYRCAGLIVIGAPFEVRTLRELASRARVPVVSVGAGRRNASVDVVRSSGDVGVAMCVRHLASLGHRDIAYVHGSSMPPAALRLSGYLRAMGELSLPPAVTDLPGDYTEECGAEAARRLLAARRLPTAVVTGNDQAALGLILTLARAGVSVPDQVSVTGFDDSRYARLSAVDLTTVRQDPRDMGSAAVEVVLRRVRDPAVRPREVVIPTTLIERGSTAAPR